MNNFTALRRDRIRKTKPLYTLALCRGNSMHRFGWYGDCPLARAKNEIEAFAKASFKRANRASTAIQFSVNAMESRAHYTKNAELGSIRASTIADEPEYAVLETNYGMAAWGVILSVDLRGSSNRALRIKAKKTYLTMHTYLPTMAELVGRAKGKIVGLRGDGLFAAFGLTKSIGTGTEVAPEKVKRAVQDATNCGKAMLESITEIINPILSDNDIEAGLEIGVGIAAGEVVVTRIGLEDANELTTYGPSVNHACKLCTQGKNEIMLTPGAEKMFPTGKGGRVTFHKKGDAFYVKYPADMKMLNRHAQSASK